MLGARIVETRADPALARAARDVLKKVEAVLPARLKDRIEEAALFAPGFRAAPAGESLTRLRGAIRQRRKVAFAYQDQAGTPTTRTVQPLGVFYWGATWSLGAWCELRAGFRNFRTDRIDGLAILEETFQPQPGRTLRDFFRHYQEERRG